jgi:hypothetical protein
MYDNANLALLKISGIYGKNAMIVVISITIGIVCLTFNFTEMILPLL